LKEAAKPEFLKFKDVHIAYGKGKMDYRDGVREIFVRSGIWADRREEEQGDYEDYF
jgi:hypothetical protein